MMQFTSGIAVVLITCTSYVTACQSRWSRRSSPILEMGPLPSDSDSTLIWNKPHYKNSTKFWENQLNKFLKPYFRIDKPENIVDCKYLQPSKGEVCDVNIDGSYAPCNVEYHYGYGFRSSGPCIFLKLAQFPKTWTPVPYNSTTVASNMPVYLKEHLRISERTGNFKVWLSCEGENAADMENLGPVEYFPSAGFPVNYLVNTDVEGYLSPLVAVRFENPSRGILINVLCTAWAKNIPNDPEAKIGTVHFELMID